MTRAEFQQLYDQGADALWVVFEQTEQTIRTLEAAVTALTARMQELADVFVTIVTYEGQMRGWLSYLAQSKTAARQVAAYRKRRRHVEWYRAIPLLDYDERAAGILERITSARVRVGTMGLKIAAIALANDANLLTRNTAHFEKAPGLCFENWAD